MIIFLFAFLAGFLKSLADTLRVPEKFLSSIFAKYSGHRFIDPQSSWVNKYILGYWLSFIIAPFSDLWHLCYTFMILFLLLIAPWYYYGLPIYNMSDFLINLIAISALYITLGIGAETGFRIWKK